MGTNNIINIPEGYEIDKDKSNDRKIVLKKIESKMVSSWEKYCELMKGKDSYYFSDIDEVVKPSEFDHKIAVSEFVDKEDVEAFAAFSKLLKLRKNWVGNWKPDWEDKGRKFTITSFKGRVVVSISKYSNYSMSFPTNKMRTLFFDTFRDLLEQAKPLL